MRAEHPIPLYLASLTPAMLTLTGEVADGWLGTSFVPEGADAAYFTHLDSGLARSGRTRADLDVCQGAEVSFASDEKHLKELIDSRKTELAFSLGGMGSASTNFYNQAYSRQGWSDVAAAVKERWQAGDREGAAALITDEMVLATTLIGTPQWFAIACRSGATPAWTPCGSTRPASASKIGSPRWGRRSSWCTRSRPAGNSGPAIRVSCR